MSKKDTEAGAVWDQVLTAELEATNFGIVCLTPSNLESRWINFEAGALSKAVGRARVVPLLYELDDSDVGPPLSRFQMKHLNEEGIYELLTSISSALEEDEPKPDLDRLFKSLWRDLKEQLDAVPTGPEARERNERELLKEILGLVRGMHWDDSDILSYTNATMSASGPGYLVVSEQDTPPSKRIMDRLVKIAGPEGAVTISGTVPDKVVTVQSPNLRPKDTWHVKFDDLRFLGETGRYLKDYGVTLVLLSDPYEGAIPIDDESPNDLIDLRE